MAQQLQIRNSTAEFLIFQAEDKAQGVQVYYQDEMIWATQEAIATLFDKGRSTITEHLKNIFETGELDQNSVCRKFRRTAADGKNYETQFYNLDAIISGGRSVRGTPERGTIAALAVLAVLAGRPKQKNAEKITFLHFFTLFSPH